MDTKPKISANGTYIFDAEDIEQLDELSFTSMVTALNEAIPEDDSERNSSGIAPSDAGDTTINELLNAQSVSDDQQPGFPAEPDPSQTAGDLIDPELLFPDLTPNRQR